MRTNAFPVHLAGPHPAHGTALPQHEVFANKVDINQLMRPMYLLLALMFVLFALLVSLTFVLFRVDGTLALIGAGVVAAALCAVLYHIKKQQLVRYYWSGTTLTLSATGLVVDEPYQTIHLPWDQVRGVGRGHVASPYKVRFNTGARGMSTRAAAPHSHPDDALIGTGTVTLKPKLPLTIWMTLRLDAALRTAIMRQPLCAVIVGHYDRNWNDGRIGHWIRTYRPDVLDAVEDVPSSREPHAQQHDATEA